MSKKKILILSMSCNQDFFNEQTEMIKKTWAKDIIDGKYDNIDFLTYYGWDEQHTYDKEKHIIKVRCEDDLDNTFKKTYYTLSLIHKNMDYDYIFRTNTSTYINIPLLDAFVQQLEDDEVLWTSELYSLSESFTPFPLYAYGRGNGLLFSKKIVDIIIGEGMSFLYMGKCDDWIIGNILNTFWIKQGHNYLDHIKSFKHGWFKCVNVDCPNGHQLCTYYNINSDFEFLKQFITIQIKRYRERDQETDIISEVYSVMSTHTDNELEDTVKDNLEYSKNPSVFLGSILGYCDYNFWVKFDKNKLYELQVNNKANDDAEKYNMKNRIWY